MESATLELKQGDGKKHSVVYNYEGEDYRMAVYLPRKLLERLGYPRVLAVTFEAKE